LNHRAPCCGARSTDGVLVLVEGLLKLGVGHWFVDYYQMTGKKIRADRCIDQPV